MNADPEYEGASGTLPQTPAPELALDEPTTPVPEDGIDLESAEARRHKLRRRLRRRMFQTITEHGLIEEGDKILVAISGGKDSYTMLDLLYEAIPKSPVRFEILAFHLDQGQPGHDDRRMRAWLEAFGAPWHIHYEDTYSIVKEKVGDSGKSYCAPCSRLRRGVLYTHAERLGCNKIALGHHREDALQTLLLNLFYSGKLEAMPAAYTTNDGRYRVIRPLIECAEEDIAAQSTLTGYPILPCNLCGSQSGLKRVRVRRLIEELEGEIPDLRRTMMAAIGNVRPSHLLDREVAEAWNRHAHEYEPRK